MTRSDANDSDADDSVVEAEPAPRLMIVDDDQTFCDRLARAMSKRGYVVSTAVSGHQARAVAVATRPQFVVLDLRLGKESGFDLLGFLRSLTPQSRVVLLSAYANVASAVAAIKAGAVDYLAKPADADMIDAALRAPETRRLPQPPDRLMSADRAKWEYINRIFEQSDRNVSRTARRLGMYRRTLQRILTKHAPSR